jgi:uncharacterized membrane protein
MKLTVRQMTISAILLALMVVMGVVGIWAIPVPNLAGAMTIMHIPIIIGAILCGPLVGLVLSLVFAIFVQIMFGGAFPPWVLMPGRLFIGPLAWLAYVGIKKLFSKQGEMKPYISVIIGSLITLGIFAIGYYALLPKHDIISQIGSSVKNGITDPEALKNYQTSAISYIKDIRFIGIIFASISAIVLGFISYFGLTKSKAEVSSVSVSAIVGTLTNSVLTLGLAVIFPTPLGETIVTRFKVALGVFATNTILETVLAVLICAAIVPTLLKILNPEVQEG